MTRSYEAVIVDLRPDSEPDFVRLVETSFEEAYWSIFGPKKL